ncbi:MAG: HD domain-containing protein [Anaerolineales bacterium]|jgi:uncharacterized protein
MPTIEQAQAWYASNDPVHGFDHVLRVYHLAERIGAALDADLEVLRAAALMHDASGAHPGDEHGRASHERQSADFARATLESEGWEKDRIEAVMHCIRAHRYRGEERPQSMEAKILFDADKLDVIGAFGVARTIGYAVQAGQPVFAAPSEQFLATGEEQPGEPHSAYHEYLFKLRRVPDRLYTTPARDLAAARVQLMVAFFEGLRAEAAGAA